MDMRYRAILLLLFAAAASAAVWMGPSCFSSVVGFFWPLLLSTAFFLSSVAVLLKISPPQPSSAEDGEKLMDYVAGKPLQDDMAEGAALRESEESNIAERKKSE